MFRAAMPLFLAAALSTAATAQDAASRPLRPRTTAEDLQMFSQVLNQIRVNHPDSLDMHDLFMAAIEGMIHAADPHSFVIREVYRQPPGDLLWAPGLAPSPILSLAMPASAPADCRASNNSAVGSRDRSGQPLLDINA